MFAAIAAPGPTVIFALNNAARFGIRFAIWGSVGAIIADVILISTIGFFIDAVWSVSEHFFIWLKYAGAAWLVFAGVKMIFSSTQSNSRDQVVQTPLRAVLVVKGFVFAVSNPKYYIFLVALLPQFVNTAIPVISQYIVLIVITVAIDALVMMAYAAMGAFSISMWSEKGTVWVSRISGGVLVFLAATFLYVDVNIL